MPIYWSQFSWEAFATLVPGSAAVIGAVAIGLRQAGIARQQVAIQERQVALSELTLRGDLFDRRWAVYDATRAFVTAILQHAAEPDTKLQAEFLMALNRAQFLFAPTVKEELSVLWARSCNFFGTVSIMDHQFQTTGQYGQENIDAKYAYLQWLNQTVNRLGDIFGDELKLAGATNPTPRPPPPLSPPSPADSVPPP